MDVQFALRHRAQVEEFQRQHRIGILTLLFTDIVGSTDLKQQLGDRAAGALLLRHHAIVRELLAQFPEAEEIDRAGDSFFLVFAKPSDAVRFALLLQAALRAEGAQSGHGLQDRVGIHVGEVFIQNHSAADRSHDLFGIQVDATARIMSLARGNQILISRFAFDSARQVLRGQEIAGVGKLAWLNHGAYELKGVSEPFEIGEVGEEGSACLAAPSNSEKARRLVPEDEPVLGWRPAIGQTIPGSAWVLEEMLGTGGFGEVWLGRHKTLREERVFKFCFHSDRVRSLKHEVRIFRILKERCGAHPNIVPVLDVYFDEPPFYIMMDHARGLDLAAWCQAQGGAAAVPLAVRLEIVAQVADALQAAHAAGVIHRDVKPANILVTPAPHAAPPLLIKLTDFGIGQVLSQEILAEFTQSGGPASLVHAEGHGLSGTHLYMAPELFTGRAASPQSDIYSLGVVLFQLVVGDLARPVTIDWQRDVSDPLLREDLGHCFAGNPTERFAQASDLSQALRAYERRQAALLAEELRQRRRERAAYRRGVARAAAIATVIIVVMVGLALYAFRQAGRAQIADQASQHRALRVIVSSGVRLMDDGDFLGALPWFLEALKLDSSDPARAAVHRVRIGAVLQRCPRLVQFWHHSRSIRWVSFSPSGHQLAVGLEDGSVHIWNPQTGAEAVPTLQQPSAIHFLTYSPDGKTIATATADGSAAVWDSSTGRLMLTLPHDAPLRHLAFHPSGAQLATACDDGRVRLWDIHSRKVLATLAHSNLVNTVAFSPKGDRIVTASKDRLARLWDPASMRVIFLPHRGEVIRATFNHAGNRILTASHDGTARLWKADTGEALWTFHHRDWVSEATFSPDDTTVLTTSFDQTARLWDAETGRFMTPPLHHPHSVLDGAFSPDSHRYVTASFDQAARVWSADSSEAQLSALHHSRYVQQVGFSPDGQLLMTVGADRIVRLWSVEAGNGLLSSLEPAPPIEHATFSPDGALAVTAGEGGLVSFWDARTGRALAEEASASEETIKRILFNADGSRFLAMGRKAVTLWNTAARRPMSAPFRHLDRVERVCFSGTAGHVLTATRGAIYTWIPGQTNPVAQLALGASNSVLAFSPGGARFLVRISPRSSQVCSIPDGQPVAPPLAHQDTAVAAQFSPDGTRVVIACSNDRLEEMAAQVWDVATGRPCGQPLRHWDGVLSAEFSADGKRVVTASEDAAAGVWDAATGEMLIPFLRHNYQMTHASFSGDDRFISTSSLDRTARVWDALTGEPVTPILRHPDALASAVLSPRADRLLTRSDEGRAKLWDLTPETRSLEELVDQAELLSGRRINSVGGLDPVEPEVLDAIWKRSRTRSTR